jgi:hypothetical protein
MYEETEAGNERFVYTNWYGKSFLADEQFAMGYRLYFIQQGFQPGDISLLSAEQVTKRLPEISDDLVLQMINGYFTA